MEEIVQSSTLQVLKLEMYSLLVEQEETSSKNINVTNFFISNVNLM